MPNFGHVQVILRTVQSIGNKISISHRDIFLVIPIFMQLLLNLP